MCWLIAIRKIPDRIVLLADLLFVDGATLDGGVFNTTGFAQLDKLFVSGSIFDGGSP